MSDPKMMDKIKFRKAHNTNRNIQNPDSTKI